MWVCARVGTRVYVCVCARACECACACACACTGTCTCTCTCIGTAIQVVNSEVVLLAAAHFLTWLVTRACFLQALPANTENPMTTVVAVVVVAAAVAAAAAKGVSCKLALKTQRCTIA